MGDTRKAIMDAAERLVRARGYNGFSYRDLAEEIGIKTASIHYHFPCKGDLGKALVERDREEIAQALVQFDAEEPDPQRRLERFLRLFQANTIDRDNRMCLGGMLAVEQDSVPEAIGQAVRQLFAQNEGWLARLLEEGRKRRQFHFQDPAEEVARALFSSLEGALVTARVFKDSRRFEATARLLLQALVG